MLSYKLVTGARTGSVAGASADAGAFEGDRNAGFELQDL